MSSKKRKELAKFVRNLFCHICSLAFLQLHKHKNCRRKCKARVFTRWFKENELKRQTWDVRSFISLTVWSHFSLSSFFITVWQPAGWELSNLVMRFNSPNYKCFSTNQKKVIWQSKKNFQKFSFTLKQKDGARDRRACSNFWQSSKFTFNLCSCHTQQWLCLFILSGVWWRVFFFAPAPLFCTFNIYLSI